MAAAFMYDNLFHPAPDFYGMAMHTTLPSIQLTKRSVLNGAKKVHAKYRASPRTSIYMDKFNSCYGLGQLYPGRKLTCKDTKEGAMVMEVGLMLRP